MPQIPLTTNMKKKTKKKKNQYFTSSHVKFEIEIIFETKLKDKITYVATKMSFVWCIGGLPCHSYRIGSHLVSLRRHLDHPLSSQYMF